MDKVEVLEPEEQLPKECDTDELGSQSTVREVELVKLPDDGLEVSVLYCQLTVVPSACAGVL